MGCQKTVIFPPPLPHSPLLIEHVFLPAASHTNLGLFSFCPGGVVKCRAQQVTLGVWLSSSLVPVVRAERSWCHPHPPFWAMLHAVFFCGSAKCNRAFESSQVSIWPAHVRRAFPCLMVARFGGKGWVVLSHLVWWGGDSGSTPTSLVLAEL